MAALILLAAAVIEPDSGTLIHLGKKMYDAKKNTIPNFLKSEIYQHSSLHYRQIHCIRGYEKSNLKSLIIGNLYVKKLAFLEKDPS